ncbi:MAG: hypothetical protein ACKVQR_22255 [Aquabacterium sp.]
MVAATRLAASAEAGDGAAIGDAGAVTSGSGNVAHAESSSTKRPVAAMRIENRFGPLASKVGFIGPDCSTAFRWGSFHPVRLALAAHLQQVARARFNA